MSATTFLRDFFYRLLDLDVFVVHCFVACSAANIMITNSGICKLADFGVSVQTQRSSFVKMRGQEMIQELFATEEDDIGAAGSLCWSTLLAFCLHVSLRIHGMGGICLFVFPLF